QVGPVAANSIVLAIGGWRFDNNYTVNTSAPSGFTEVWEVTGNHPADVQLAAALVANGSSVNPAAFGDHTSNVSGSAAMTITIGLQNIASNSIFIGLAAGTTAGAAHATPLATTGVDRWEWVRGPTLTSGAAGAHTFSIYTRDDGTLVDTIAIA